MGLKGKELTDAAKKGKNLEKLQQKLSDFKKLFAVSEIINSTLDIDELLDRSMKVAGKIMEVEASALMLIDKSTKELVFKIAHGKSGDKVKEIRLEPGQGIAGRVAREAKPVLINNVENDPRHFKRADEYSGFKTRAVLCVPLKVKDITIGVLQVLNPKHKKGFDSEDQELLGNFSSMAAIAIENARMHTSLLEKQRVEDELKIGHQIQQNFLSSKFPEYDGLLLDAKNIPALELGGDFYDFLDFGAGRVGIVVGDVSGKGVPAALFMVKAMSEIRFHASLFAKPGKLMEKINNILVEKSILGMFVTLLIGIVDSRKKTLISVNAGHYPFLIRDGRGNISEAVCEPELPVGVVPDVKFGETVLELRGGETIIGYTDGIIEARNISREEFGKKRFFDIIKDGNINPEKTIECILDKVVGFSKGAPQHDDLTLVAATLKNN